MASEQVSSGIGECLARLDTLTNIVLAQSKNVSKISKRLKQLSSDNTKMLEELDCKMEDVQGSVEECLHDVESLKSKNRITHIILRKLAQGLNLPSDQFLSDTENNKMRKFGGSRENLRRRKHRRDRYMRETVHEKSCDSDSDSSEDTDDDRFSTTSSTTIQSTTQVHGLLAPSGQGVTTVSATQIESTMTPDGEVSNLQYNRHQHEGDRVPSQGEQQNITITHRSSPLVPDQTSGNTMTTQQNVLPKGNQREPNNISNGQQRTTQSQSLPVSVDSPVSQNSAQLLPSSVSLQPQSGARSFPSMISEIVNFDSPEKFMESLSVPLNEETKQAIALAFSADSDRAMERPAGLYTIILLDTSGSIQASAKDQIRDFITNFIDEIEDSAATDHLEENVALVTFGGRTGIERDFNNDYSIIQDAYESLESAGRSPMLTGLAVCLAYMHRIAKSVDVDTKREPCQPSVKIAPRIVMITDGLITDDHTFKGPDVEANSINAKSKMLKFMETFNKQGYPLYCVGVGEDFDKTLLTDMVKGTRGKLMKHDKTDASLLGQHYLLQTIAGKVIHEFREQGGYGDPQRYFLKVLSTYNDRLKKCPHAEREIAEILQNYDIRVDTANIQEAIVNSVAFEQEIEAERQSVLEESDDEELKSYGCDEYGRLPVIGSRVRRGPHWQRGNEDHKGHGTVVAHATEEVVVVKWDNKIVNQYHYTTTQQEITNVSVPRLVMNNHTIHVGCWVKRGKDWNRGDDDGNAEHGVVIRKHRDKTVTVRWPIGTRDRYSFGKDDKFEIEVLGGDAALVEDIQSDTDSPAVTGGGGDRGSVGGGGGAPFGGGGGNQFGGYGGMQIGGGGGGAPFGGGGGNQFGGYGGMPIGGGGGGAPFGGGGGNQFGGYGGMPMGGGMGGAPFGGHGGMPTGGGGGGTQFGGGGGTQFGGVGGSQFGGVGGSQFGGGGGTQFGGGGSDMIPVWQFQDANLQWRTLSLENSTIVESSENSQKPGTVLVQHKGVQMRVDAKKLKYREQSGSGSGTIRRTMMSMDEFQTIFAVENAI